jgi:hypothetical protein
MPRAVERVLRWPQTRTYRHARGFWFEQIDRPADALRTNPKARSTSGLSCPIVLTESKGRKTFAAWRFFGPGLHLGFASDKYLGLRAQI